MQGNDLNEMIIFPKNFPKVSTGVFLKQENVLITGHENGLVVRWNIQNKKHSRLYDCNSPVSTISYSNDGRIAVGCNSGGLFVLSLSTPDKIEILQEPTYSKYSRVWRTVWLDKDRLIMTSTYGEVKLFDHVSPDLWETGYLRGHSDSVFGIGSSNGKYLLTGDYRGNILIWEHSGDRFKQIQKLGIPQTVEDAYWYKDEAFAVINSSGRIYLFEKESKETPQWQPIYEIDIATGFGNCINITDDGKTIFAGTKNEVIQFDRDSQQTEQINIPNSKRIFSFGNTIYVLNHKGLCSFKRKIIEVKKDLINYKFAKIGLLGHTGTGKTTLCNYLLYNKIQDAKSTFGKRIWNWILPDGKDFERRIILIDHGGQEGVLETFFPLLRDLDIILIFFKQTDKTTFEKACHILDHIKGIVGTDTKKIFVQTFIDHEMNEIPEIEIQHLKSEGQIIDNIKISPKEKIGLEEFKKRILGSVSWADARIMIKSPYTEGISQLLSFIHKKGYPAVAYGRFKELYQNLVKEKISDRHLKFLLNDYTNQGIIEYYPEISDLIIFNDDRYNKLTTNIPIYVEHKKGIVSIEELEKEFGRSAYLRIIDEVYLNSKVSIKNGN
ncbi:MAG: hypothetical protein ACTSR2_14830, partial [Candidatus Hodarchaeales archaeon]